MNEVKIKIEFNAYYNKRKGVFDEGGVYPILEYLKDNKYETNIDKICKVYQEYQNQLKDC